MVLNYDNNNGFYSVFDNLKKQIPEVSSEANKFFDDLNKLQKIRPNKPIDFEGFIKDGNIADESLISFIKTTDSSKISLANYQSYLQSTAKQTTTFATITQKAGSALKTIGGAFLSAFANMAVMYAASAAIEAIGKSIYNAIYATEIAIEKGEQARKLITDIGDAYTSKQNTVSTNKDRYVELSQGVDNATNQNLSLTTDQYSEFLSISNQLAETFPSLVTGYDSQGNALLSLSGNADDTSASLEKLLEQERQLADFKISQNLQTAFDGTMAQIGQLQDEIDGLNESIDLYNTLSDSMSKMTDGTTLSDLGFTSSEDTAFMKQFVKYGDTNGQEAVNVMQQAFTKAAKDAGLEENVNFSSLVNQDIFKNGENGYEWSAQLWGATKEQLETFKSSYMAYMDEMGGDVAEYTSDALLLKQQDTQEIQANWQSMVQSLITSMSVYDGYNKLGDNIKQAINTGIGKIDPVKEWMDENGEINAPSNIRGYLREKFLDPITSVLNDESLSLEDKNSFQNTIDSIFSLDKSTLSSQEYQNQLNSYLDSIRKFFDSDEKFNDFVLTFGFKVQTDDGQIIDSRDSLINSISDRIGKGNDTSADITSLDELTYEQLVNVETKYTDSSNGKTLAEIIEEETAKAQNTIDSNPITFSSLFASDEDGSLNKVVDNFQSSMSTIQGIFESINKGEKLDLGNIGQQLPELAGATDNLSESLSNLQIDKVKDFASQYKSLISGITDPQELAKAQQYFQDVLSSIDLSNVNVDSLRSQVMDMIWSGITGKDSIDRAQAIMDEFSSELQTQEGLEILFKIFADPSNANTEIQNLRSQYDNSEIIMKVRVIEDLQSDLSIIQDEASRLQSNIDNKTAIGIKVQNSDYAKLIRNGNQQISNLKKQIKSTESLQQEYDKGSKAYKNYQNEIDNLSASIDEMAVKQYEWIEAMQNLPVTNAQNLTSALSSAMSELQSETGLTNDSIKTLNTQFSDLERYDPSSVFYASAKGVKVNTSALKDFINQQNAVQEGKFAEEIKRQKDAIKSYQDQIGLGNTDSKLQSMQNNLEGLMQRQAQYFAQYKSQMEQMSDFQAIQNAKNTKNAGSNYDQMISELKTAKEAYDKDLVGTDDFKTVAKYLSPNGFEDAANFAENYAKAQRYLTEDSSKGVVNFLEDLNKKGYATYETLANGVKQWSLNIEDAKKAAYDMGMGEEFFTDVLDKTEDYGFVNATVNSLSEGSVKIEEANTKLVDAYAKLAEMQASGASETAIADQMAVIEKLKGQVSDLTTATETYKEVSAQAYGEGLSNLEEQISLLEKSRKEALDDKNYDAADELQKRMQSIADEYGVKLKITAEGIEIDSASYQQALKDAGIGSVENPLSVEDLGLSLTPEQTKNFDTTKSKLIEQKDAFKDYYDVLRQYSAEDLKDIQLGNGEYDVSGDMMAAEDALQAIADQAGLSQEQVSQLLNALQAIGVLKPKVDVNTQSVQDGITKLERMQELGQINSHIDLTAEVSEMTDDELSQRYTDLINIKAKIVPDTDEYDAVCALIEQTTLQMHVNAAIESSGGIDEFLNMSQEEQKQVLIDVGVKDDDIDATLDKIQSMQDGTDVPITVKLDEGQFSQLTSVQVNTDEAKSNIQEVQDELDNLKDGDADVNVETDKAVGNIKNVKSLLGSLNGYTAHVYATLHDNVTSMISSIRTSLLSLNGTTAHTYVQTHEVKAPKATGTMLSPARASGTAYNVLNMKPAYANGKVTLPRNEQALVNEEEINGHSESIVRDGKWFLIPGGAHVENLKKGDLIFSAKQTDDLMKYGKIPGHARAYAQGTVAYNGMPAHASISIGQTLGGNKYTSDKTAVKNLNNASSNVSKAASNLSSAAQQTSEAADDTKEAFDYIQIKLERLQSQYDDNIRTAENVMSISNKLKYYNKADSTIVEQIKANQQGAVRYEKEANSVGLDPAIAKLVREGTIDISKYSEDTQKLISDYQNWYELMLDCQEAVKELTVQQKELAQTKIDTIVDKYSKIADTADARIGIHDSELEYRQTAGYSNVSSRQKALYNDSIKVEEYKISKNQSLAAILQNEINAQLASGVMTKYSDAYYDAMTKLREFDQSIYESKTAIEEYNQELRAMKTTKLQRVFDKISRWADQLKGILNLKEARGQNVTEIDYNSQVTANNDKIIYQYALLKDYLDEQSNYEYGSEKWQELAEKIADAKNNINELLVANEELKNSIVDERWEVFNDMQDDIDNTITELDYLRNALDGSVDSLGNLTDDGQANIAILGKELSLQKQKIADYNKALSKLDEEFRNGNIDQNEYSDKQKEFRQIIRESSDAVRDYEDDLIDLWKTQIQARNDALQEEIDLRQKALDEKKKYHDYDKQLKSQTKELNILKAQAAALEGVKSFALIYLIAGKP